MFPSQLDDDTTIPPCNDNIVEIGSEIINALRDAVFNIETNIGINAQGSTNNISERLGVSLNADGTIKSSALTSLGLVTLPITNSQISNTAAIAESKLNLNYSTTTLYNYIFDLKNDVNSDTTWISTIGIKLDPHINGSAYHHALSNIDVSTSSSNYLKNKFNINRNNSNSYQLINDINNDYLDHVWSDGYSLTIPQNITTKGGSIYPSNYAHTASGLFLDTSRFSLVPQTANDLQSFAEFIDNSSIFLYGTRIQNLYSNGISRTSRSANLVMDGYGDPLVLPTSVIAYLLNDGSSSAPVDDINSGDDLIEFKPIHAFLDAFSASFSKVQIGDIIRINYGSVETQFIIKEIKIENSEINPLFSRYFVRIAGKNLFYTTNGVARIDRSLVNKNKYGVLATSAVNSPSNNISSSLIISSPRGAQALGLGFNPNQIDSSHYLLYLQLYPTSQPDIANGMISLPGIDVSGNQGKTPGFYTLDSVVEATNNAFRKAGYNYRFIAFSFNGNFGIMLADSYNNASFSITSGIFTNDIFNSITFDSTASNIAFPNNILDLNIVGNKTIIDPLGIGPNGSNIASPKYQIGGALPTKIFLPLKRNNFYVDGVEKDKLNKDVDQNLDIYGDGYWFATVDGYNQIPGPPGRTQVIYRINQQLDNSLLQVGKTLVVQGLNNGGNIFDFGRFIIEDITFNCPPDNHTNITVYDGVHAVGTSPNNILPIGSTVAIYFGADSVSFNKENLLDFSSVSPFKRHFEIFIDSQGNTFTHERARFYNGPLSSVIVNNISLSTSSIKDFDFIKVSPKLRGYQFGTITKISLFIFNYNNNTGIFDGYLATTQDGINFTNCGIRVSGKKGEIVRFYDESNVDYIDVKLNINKNTISFTNQYIDIQLFPSLLLDDQIIGVSTCQFDDSSNIISNVLDIREFGNTSEKDLTNSALNFINASARLLHSNGVIKGFEQERPRIENQIYLSGGTALINGNVIEVNAQTISLPPIQELNNGNKPINWALCINERGELQTIPLLDTFGDFGQHDNSERVFTAINIVNNLSYSIDSVSFSKLVNNRKDLTILYIINCTVSAGPAYLLVINDARKFIFNESANIPLTWVPQDTDKDIVGHFNSFDSLINWINFYGSHNNDIKVSGNFNITDILDLSTIQNSVNFIGNGAVFNISTSAGFFVKEGVKFKNITFNYDPLFFDNTGNINSNNGSSGCIIGDTSETIYTKNIIIDECIFNSTVPAHPPYIVFNLTGNNDGYIDNIIIKNNIFNDSTDHPPAIVFINNYEGAFSTFTPTISNIDIKDNICNQNQVFYIVSTFNSVDTPGLSAVNVKITGNKVGYIAYNIDGNKYYNTSSSSSVVSGLLIERNSAIAVLSPVDQTGKFNNTALNITHATGNVIINNNTLNFIAVASRDAVNGTQFIGNTVISNNRLLAYDYQSTVYSIFNITDPAHLISGVAQNSAIFVNYNDSATSGMVPNVIIEGNQILSNAIYSTVYNYIYAIKSYSSCIIRDNIINIIGSSGGIGVPGIGITVGSKNPFTPPTDVINYNIYNNNIYRNGYDINSYIYIGPSCQGEIRDNTFDSSYIDEANTDTNVVKGYLGTIPPNYRNKNQIYTINFRSGEHGRLVGDNASPITVYDDLSLSATSYSAGSNNYIKYGPSSETTAWGSGTGYPPLVVNTQVGTKVTWIIPLENYIPAFAKIINGKIDTKIQGSAGDKIITWDLWLKQDSTTGDVNYGTVTETYSGSSVFSSTLTLLPNSLTYVSTGFYMTITMKSTGAAGTFLLGTAHINYIY